MRVFKYIIPIIVFSALLIFSKADSYAAYNSNLVYTYSNSSYSVDFYSDFPYVFFRAGSIVTILSTTPSSVYKIENGNTRVITSLYAYNDLYVLNWSLSTDVLSSYEFNVPVYSDIESAYSALTFPPTYYDESISLGTLFKTEASLLNVTGGILDAGCIYIWWGFGNAKSIDFTVLVNGSVTQRFSRSNSFILQYADFNYSDIPAGNGDIVTVQALPLDDDGNWGNIKSISFTVNTNYVRDHGNGITDNSSVTPTLYGSSPYIQPVPVVEYRGKESSIVSTTTVYVQNYTYTGISQEQFDDLLQLIRDLPGALQHGDEPSDIISENDYQFKINFGDSSQGQYDNGKGFISSTADDTSNIVGTLVGTPFEPISDSIFTVLAVLVGIAFVLVLIKVVGLII